MPTTSPADAGPGGADGGRLALETIVPDWPPPPGVRAFSTTRRGGVSDGPYASLNLGANTGDDHARVAENRARIARHAGFPADPLWLTQVHGTAVVDEQAPPGVAADGRYTAVPGVVCAVLAADCLPLLLASADGTEIAAVHGGWRGLAGGIVARAVARFRAPPGALRAWLGPAIGPAAYRVGLELMERFPACARPAFEHRADGLHLDLYAAARALLRESGVEAVYGGHWCTATQAQRFFSHRRDGVTGRMATFIWIAAPGR